MQIPLPGQPHEAFRLVITPAPMQQPGIPQMGEVTHPSDAEPAIQVTHPSDVQPVETVHMADLPGVSATAYPRPGEVPYPDDESQGPLRQVAYLGSSVARATASHNLGGPHDIKRGSGMPADIPGDSAPSTPKPTAGGGGNKPPVPPEKLVPGELPEEPEPAGGYHPEDFNLRAWEQVEPTPREAAIAKTILSQRVREKIRELDTFADYSVGAEGVTTALQLECETPNGITYLTVFTDDTREGSAFVAPRYFKPGAERTEYTYSSIDGNLLRLKNVQPITDLDQPELGAVTASEHAKATSDLYDMEAKFTDATAAMELGTPPRVGIPEAGVVIRQIKDAIPRRFAFADLRENSHQRITSGDPVTPEDAADGADQLDQHVRTYLDMHSVEGIPPESRAQVIQVSKDRTMEVVVGIRPDHGLDAWAQQLAANGEAHQPADRASGETPYVHASTVLELDEANQALLRRDLRIAGQSVSETAEIRIVNALEYEVREGGLHVTYEGYIVADGVLARRYELETFRGDALDAGMVRNFIHNPFHTHPLTAKFAKVQNENEE